MKKNTQYSDEDMDDMSDYDMDDNENLLEGYDEEYEEDIDLDEIDPNLLEIKSGSELGSDEGYLEDNELEAELEALEQEEKVNKAKKSKTTAELDKANATSMLQNTLLNCQKNFIHRQRSLEFLNQLPKSNKIEKYTRSSIEMEK